MTRPFHILRPFLKPALLLLFVAAGFQCKRDNTQPILTGKLVVENGCMYSAIEVLGGQFDPSSVSATWKDPDNDSVFHNVFAISEVRNACDISAYGVSKGDVFQFQMDPNPQKNVICNDCMVAFPPPALPPVSDAVMNIKKINNN
jgi:hypothetical protein